MISLVKESSRGRRARSTAGITAATRSTSETLKAHLERLVVARINGTAIDGSAEVSCAHVGVVDPEAFEFRCRTTFPAVAPTIARVNRTRYTSSKISQNDRSACGRRVVRIHCRNARDDG